MANASQDSHGKPRPWRMVVPLAAVLALAALWSAFWFYASLEAHRRFGGWRESMAKQGTELACSGESWGGYPFRFEFSCENPVLTIDGDNRIASRRLRLLAQAYNPRHVLAILDGPTTASIREMTPWNASHGQSLASIRFNGNGEPEISIEVPTIFVGGTLHIGSVLAHIRPSAGGAHQIAASVRTYRQSWPGRPQLEFDSAELLGTLTKDLRLEVENIAFQKNETRYWGAGYLTLDRDHRIEGRLTTQTNDLKTLLEILAPQFGLTADQRLGIETVLKVLGGKAEADVVAKDGELYIGPVKVADLLPLY